MGRHHINDFSKSKQFLKLKNSNLGSYEQPIFSQPITKLKLIITYQWIWTEKLPTVHLHYFIHRARQTCQTYHFFIPRWMISCQFFSNFWIWKTVDVTTSVNNFITDRNVWEKFHIPTRCRRCKNKGFQKIPNQLFQQGGRHRLKFSVLGAAAR